MEELDHRYITDYGRELYVHSGATKLMTMNGMTKMSTTLTSYYNPNQEVAND